MANLLQSIALPGAIFAFYSRHHTQPFFSFLSNYLYQSFPETPPGLFFGNYLQAWQEYLHRLYTWTKLAPRWEKAGDFHRGGTKIHSGRWIIYPTNLTGSDRIIVQLRQLLPQLAPFTPDYIFDSVIVKRRYQPASRLPATNRSRYYFAFGQLMALALFLRAIDLNYENHLVSQKRWPFIFGWETIFSPQLSPRRYNIEATGLLSRATQGNASALLYPFTPYTSLLFPFLFFQDDRPRLRYQVTFPRRSPLADHPFHYLTAIRRGFRSCAKQLASQKQAIVSALAKIAPGIKVRFVLRPTRFYRLLLLRASYPQIYQSQNIVTFWQNQLLAKQLIFPIYLSPVEKEKLIKVEIAALRSLAIPYFQIYLQDRSVTDLQGNHIFYLPASPWQVWQEHLRHWPELVQQTQKEISTILNQHFTALAKQNSKI